MRPFHVAIREQNCEKNFWLYPFQFATMQSVQLACRVQYRAVCPIDTWLTHECLAERFLRYSLSVGDASSIAEGVVQCIGVQHDGVVQVRAVNTRLNRRNKNCVSNMSTTTFGIRPLLVQAIPVPQIISRKTTLTTVSNDKFIKFNSGTHATNSYCRLEHISCGRRA